MMWRDGEVLAARRRWGPTGRQCAELDVRVTGAPAGAFALPAGTELRAVAYETLTGVPDPGERVRLEVSALDRTLGTGGHAMVCARFDVLPADTNHEGHLVKARYMPDQVMVTGVDEQGTIHHGLLSSPVGELMLEGAPVIIADLHSSLPAILAGTRAADASEDMRAVYVMTDGGALPLPYSRTAAALRETGQLAGTVTAGQAWGGDVEAVSVHNALLAARHVLGADLIVLIQGPGNLGTDTPWGFSGVACGDAVNAVAALGGRAVACLRISQADARSRHQGVSHHSLTAYGKVALAAADVVVPQLPGALGEQIGAPAVQPTTAGSPAPIRGGGHRRSPRGTGDVRTDHGSTAVHHGPRPARRRSSLPRGRCRRATCGSPRAGAQEQRPGQVADDLYETRTSRHRL